MEREPSRDVELCYFNELSLLFTELGMTTGTNSPLKEMPEHKADQQQVGDSNDMQQQFVVKILILSGIPPRYQRTVTDVTAILLNSCSVPVSL